MMTESHVYLCDDHITTSTSNIKCDGIMLLAHDAISVMKCNILYDLYHSLNLLYIQLCFRS